MRLSSYLLGCCLFLACKKEAPAVLAAPPMGPQAVAIAPVAPKELRRVGTGSEVIP